MTVSPRQLVAARLSAITVPLDVPVDLIDAAGTHGVLWERAGGVSLAGRGVAARVAVDWKHGPAGDAVAALLATIDTDGPHPPLALGALPFRRSAPAHLVVPAVLVRRQPDGSCWLTVTGTDPGPALDDVRRRWEAPGAAASAGAGPEPGEYRVRPAIDRRAWLQLVAGAVDSVESGRLAKVVLARAVTVEADGDLRPGDVARRLRASHPSCMVFSIEGFVGASPELLVETNAMAVRSQPLAGTTARPGSGDGDGEVGPRLLSSAKERREHRLVVEAVAGALAPYCDELTVPAVPGVVPLGTLAHLGTLITGRLRSPRPSALDLVGAIHPSPAVGGVPTATALDVIDAVEGLDRDRYAGPVGWVDADGDGCWALGIRSAHIEGRRARLMAGVGIVAGSDPEAELAETDLKLQPMLAAIVRP
jgi:menaquinone-specific isochorismate synthase